MRSVAPQRVSVLAAGPVIPATRAAPLPTRVDGPERGRGERGEHQRVPRHARGDGLAAGHSGADQLERVPGVGLRARGAQVRATVTTRLEHHAERHRRRPERRDDFTRARVDGRGRADELDGVGAVVRPRGSVGEITERPVPHPGRDIAQRSVGEVERRVRPEPLKPLPLKHVDVRAASPGTVNGSTGGTRERSRLAHQPAVTAACRQRSRTPTGPGSASTPHPWQWSARAWCRPGRRSTAVARIRSSGQ